MNQTESPAELVADEPLIVPVVPLTECVERSTLTVQDVKETQQWLAAAATRSERLWELVRDSLHVPAELMQGGTGANYSGRSIALETFAGRLRCKTGSE